MSIDKIIDKVVRDFDIRPRTRVFLGGTCNNSTWRDYIIPKLQVDYFNPVVDDWTPECQKIEEEEKSIHCNMHIYVITKEITGYFSIAEVVDASNKYTDCDYHSKYPYKTIIYCFLPEGMTKHQVKSLEAIGGIIENNGGVWLRSLDEIIDYVNQYKNPEYYEKEDIWE